MRILSLLLLIIYLPLSGCLYKPEKQSRDALILVNSAMPESQEINQTLLPYLRHFGIPMKILDVSKNPLPESLQNFGLVIIAHKNLTKPDDPVYPKYRKFFRRMLNSGTGIISFDPLLPNIVSSRYLEKTDSYISFDSIKIGESDHYITENHPKGKSIPLKKQIFISAYKISEGNTLLTANKVPLLHVIQYGNGRVVYWFNQEWMLTEVSGPGSIINDTFWKSLVWAARKPFVLKALPPIVTFCVKESAGFGERWKETPYYWLDVATAQGFKPWLGLFIYNVSPIALRELRSYGKNNFISLSPYAFGVIPDKYYDKKYFNPKQNYSFSNIPEYFYPTLSYSFLRNYTNEIFYQGEPPYILDINQADKNFSLVQDWYAKSQPPAKSSFLLLKNPGINDYVIHQLAYNWKIKYIATESGHIEGQPITVKDSIKNNNSFQETRFKDSSVKDQYSRNTFNDIFPVEKQLHTISFNQDNLLLWKPDNDIHKSVDEALEILEASIHSKTIAILFTSELEYISGIAPWNWGRQMKFISNGLKKYHPKFLNIDDAFDRLRDNENSVLKDVVWDPSENSITFELYGKTDGPVSVYVFTENDKNKIESKIISLPEFQNKLTSHFLIK